MKAFREDLLMKTEKKEDTITNPLVEDSEVEEGLSLVKIEVDIEEEEKEEEEEEEGVMEVDQT